MALEAVLAQFGVRPDVARILELVLTRPRGMVAFCGSTGQGKTTLAELCAHRLGLPSLSLLGDLRSVEDVRGAIEQAETRLVVVTAAYNVPGYLP